MLPLIGAFKLAKGLLILAVALGVLHLVRGDTADTLAHWASELHIDPEGRHFTRAVDRILSLDARRLKALSAGMFVYAGLFLLDYKDKPEAFRKAMRTALDNSQGVMLFDLSYLEDFNWWSILSETFTEARRAPHDVPDLLPAIRRARLALTLAAKR